MARTSVIIGLFLLLGGVAYAVAYYLTQGFYDLSEPLGELGYTNVAIAGGALCMGAVLTVVGTIGLAVGRRRGQA